MSYKTTFTYPGDPTSKVELMFGAEFTHANPDREIVIYGGDIAQHIPVDEIICDTCNAGVELYDPCAVTESRLYCWACFLEWIKPYLTRS